MREFTGEEQRANVAAWVAALRSGKYRQGPTALDGPEGHCCLGVLCEVVVKKYPETIRVTRLDGGRTAFDNLTAYLSEYLQSTVGLRTSFGDYDEVDGDFRPSLAGDNDRGIPHRILADFIESRPPGLFAFADGQP